MENTKKWFAVGELSEEECGHAGGRPCDIIAETDELDDNGQIVTFSILDGLTEANTRRIVQCHNSHDRLVEACKEQLADRTAFRHMAYSTINKMNAALAEAEKEAV